MSTLKCQTVKLSPNRSNIMYVERRRTDLKTDFSESLSTLKEEQKDTLRIIVYCRTLMICADLFSRFSYEMGKSQYYPPSAPELSENRLFGMFHVSTPTQQRCNYGKFSRLSWYCYSVCWCGNGDGNRFTWSKYNHPLWYSKREIQLTP